VFGYVNRYIGKGDEEVSKFIPALSLDASPITKSGELVTSRLGSVVTEDGEIVHGSWQIDAKEVVELLEWLDYKAPLFWSTKKLESSAKAMREALMEILEAVKHD
jgi:hypothetical protein